MGADGAYDGEPNFETLYGMNIQPNIRQREGSVNKIFRYSKKASKEFDAEVYHYRGLIEGIFGAEERLIINSIADTSLSRIREGLK